MFTSVDTRLKVKPSKIFFEGCYEITCARLQYQPHVSPTTSLISTHYPNLIMANAESPDPSKDLLPVDRTDEEVDPLAPAPEPKLPTRKDASLKEFLAKMDDYAPIVCELNSCTTSVLMGAIDPRCCDQLLSHKSRSSSPASN
jgi:hypothetical protein